MAVLRRAGDMEPLKKQVGNLTLDVENRRVMRGSKEIAVTRQMLAKDVWREPHRATPLDNVIDVHVSHLRRKIDEVQRVKLLRTVPGVDFVLREEHPV
jgi:DNA-binding response OmpR family regulator